VCHVSANQLPTHITLHIKNKYIKLKKYFFF
jgi:hypothetical protein